MSLLPLTPSVIKLRRTAKACAAGEVSRYDYRQVRREVIETFADRDAVHRDETIPRFKAEGFDSEITQRRLPVVEVNNEQVISRGWAWWIVLVMMFLAALIAPNVLGAPVLDGDASIPSVAQRDPNPATAQRIAVNRLAWQPPEFFEQASGEEVQAFLDAQLTEVQRHNAAQEHGFSAAELEEVGRFLNAIGVHDNATKMTVADLQDLSALVAAQKSKRGVSTVQLEAIAQALQTWLRELGYPVAAAFVPSQNVIDGEVRLGVEFGHLSGVVVEGAVNGADETPMHLTGLLGKPVKRTEVETKLNVLNRSQGIQTSATFVPGLEVGDSELHLQVKQNQRFLGSVQIDNHGIQALGEERVSARALVNNVRGIGDQLQLGAMSSVDPADHQFASVAYRSPILGGRFDVGARVGYGDLDLGDSVAGAAGLSSSQGLLFDVGLTDTRVLTRRVRREYLLGVGVHRFETDSLDDQEARFVHVGLVGHRLWDTSRIALEGGIHAHVGHLDHLQPGQAADWWRLKGTANAWRPLPDLGVWNALHGLKGVIGVTAQWANDGLPPSMRLSSRGAAFNRGFRHGGTQFDRGVNVTAELRGSAGLGQWSLFVDSGYGERLSSQALWSHLTSAGVGWEAQLDTIFEGLRTQLTLGYPLSHRGPGGNDDDGARLLWSLSYAQ